MNIRPVTTMLIAFTTLITLSSATDYCHEKSCGTNHTVCIYPTPGPSARCTGYISSGLSNDEKQRIIYLHNQLRQKVANGQETRGSPGPQPRAKYMPNLEWDDEIAFVAQRWADQCKIVHDACRNVDRFTVGQSIAYWINTDIKIYIKVDYMIEFWYNEVKDFSKYQVPLLSNYISSEGKVIGHYTNIVWAKSTKIGCGATKYKQGKYDTFYLVCNYAPAGNHFGEPVYEIA